MDLARHANALKMQLGQDVDTGTTRVESQPLTRMFGRDITVKPRVVADVNKPFHESSFEVEGKELQIKVDEVYPKFLITESDHLIDSLTELEIRGVAKKAGLPVTDTEPKTINTGFIDEIKEAIRLKLSPNPNLIDDPNANPNPDDDQNPDPFAPDLRTDEERAVAELQKAVNELYNVFETLDNKSIVDSYPELEIRGVAKKAGLDVTDTEPKLDAKFLNKIKVAIKKQAEISNLGK